MANTAYDVIVIGAGPVGENVADRVVRAGLTAAIVERELVGGECSYWACMPTKALLRSPAALRAARRLPGAREAVTGDLDAAAVLRRRDAFASHWHDDGQVSWLGSAGIELYRGQGRISSDRVVEVTGGGVVASEMATAYASLGSSVTLLARDGLLSRAEPFAGELVVNSLREAGVSVRLGADAASVRRRSDGTVGIALTDGGRVKADELLVAIGRTPNTQDIGLDHVGLKAGGWLPVDDTLRVLGADGAPVGDGWLYAAGDVNRRALLTHQGKYGC